MGGRKIIWIVRRGLEAKQRAVDVSLGSDSGCRTRLDNRGVSKSLIADEGQAGQSNGRRQVAVAVVGKGECDMAVGEADEARQDKAGGEIEVSMESGVLSQIGRGWDVAKGIVWAGEAR